jgi:hypothetical protein
MQGWFTRRWTILDQETIVGPVIGFAHCCWHAHIRGYASNHKILDTLITQQEVEVCVGESTTAWLVDNRLIWQRIEFVYNVMAGLSTDEKAASRALWANTEACRVIVGSELLAAGERGEIWSVALKHD